MIKSPIVRVVLGVVVVWVALGLLRFKPWRSADTEEARPRLAVGFLPVT